MTSGEHTKGADLLALADRVEKLTGPDREVDREIARACGIAWSSDEDGQFGGYNITPRRIRFTESLDAAMTLAPEGHDWRVDTMTGLPGAIVCVPNAWLSHKTAPSIVHGATVALALTAACLRALTRFREAQAGGGV